MSETRNYVIAIVLSIAVLLGWQFFVAGPQLEAQRKAAEAQRLAQQAAQGQTPGATSTAPAPGTTPAPTAGGAVVPGAVMPTAADRATVIAASERVIIDTPSVIGSINLLGARFDDLRLKSYRETIDPKSPIITLLSPAGAPAAYYAEFGWVADPATPVTLPNPQTKWRPETSNALAPGQPVTLAWDNGQGFIFRRKVEIDEKYLFTITDTVENQSGKPATLYPYGLISRHETPKTAGFYILHEGLIGVFGDEGLKEIGYADMKKTPVQAFDKVAGSWLGFVDKYWATAIVPESGKIMQPRFSYNLQGTLDTYQTDMLGEAIAVPGNGTASFSKRLMAGAKEVGVIDGYAATHSIDRFDRLIDWGWFYFLTKPLFYLIDWLFKLFGNFGVAILAVTVIIKLVFFPLANKSYDSMAKMKKVQPEMMEIRDKLKDDKMKQQQAMMELYKREKINPLAGCLPILVQIPVFFALYKVLFVTIEMRHAPFFGWIKDLSAADPTSIFNLFGLIPWDPPTILMLGIWPIIMGITMFVQMKLNPAPTDPTQKIIFDWMPIVFTFMLAAFPAGLVIYWAWNNFLSILQQVVIMKKNKVPVEIWDNIKSTFKKTPAPAK
jgi:YidC/Oxa1 family membrane protein insertase